MAWSTYLFQVSSGQIGPQVEGESATWSISLNETENVKINLKKSSLPRVNLDYWLSPWWSGVLIMWNEEPVFAGPIVSRPAETFGDVSVDCRGIRSILAKRFIIIEHSNWGNLAKSVIQFRGLSLGTIAKRVVEVSQQKPGGLLPISYPVPDQDVDDDADHQRTYRGFNISNIDCDSVLTKLSNVTDGPDIMFKPRLVNASQLTLDLWTGTEDEPRIYQNNIPVWDTTSVKSSVTDMQITATGAYQTHRVFAIGAGQDEGTLIKMAQNLTPSTKNFPLLETYIASGQTENPAVALGHAKSTLNQNTDMLQEITMTTRVDGVYPFGSYWSGDKVQIVTKDWISLDDGIHNARLLNMSGSLSSDIRLSMQTEE